MPTVVSTIPWSGSTSFNDSALEFTATPTQVDTLLIAADAAGYAHSHTTSGMIMYIDLRNADTLQWTQVFNAAVPSTTPDEVLLAGLSVSFQPMRVSGIRFYANMGVNQTYHGMDSTNVFTFQLSAPVEKPLGPASIQAAGMISSKVVNVTSGDSVSVNASAQMAAKGTRMGLIESAIGAQASTNSNSLKHFKTFKAAILGAASLIATAKKYKTGRTNIVVNATLTAYRWDREIMADIFRYLPKYYNKSQIIKYLVQVKSNEFTRYNVLLQDLLDQFFIDSATWILPRLESKLGLEANATLSLEERRTAIKEKINGYGTMTVQSFKQQAERFFVSEIMEDNLNYLVQVRLGEGQIEDVVNNFSKYEEMKGHLFSIIPAHLNMEVKFKNVTWGELKDSSLTWGDLQKFSWGQLKS